MFAHVSSSRLDFLCGPPYYSTRVRYPSIPIFIFSGSDLITLFQHKSTSSSPSSTFFLPSFLRINHQSLANSNSLGMNECSIHEEDLPATTTKPVAVVVGMTLADSNGGHMTELRGGLNLDNVSSFNDQNALSVADDDKSSRKRRLERDQMMLLEKQEQDDCDEKISPTRGTFLTHGFVSVIGRRREMEDAVAIELGFLTIDNSRDYDFFGVYDGHGGSRVANSCQGRLHHLLVEECKTTSSSSYFGEEIWSRIMIKCFLKMDEEVNSIKATTSSSCAKSESYPVTIGSTAVVAVVGEDEVVVANCGDSRAVLSRGGIPLSISNDHKPDRPDELERIESAGGKVIDWDGHRVLGVLATSRSIGDEYLQPYVIPEPEVMITKRTNADEFLILATDGLWDVVSNEMACLAVKRILEGRSLKKKKTTTMIRSSTEEELVEKKKKKKMYGRAQVAAGLLVELAKSRGSKDNITVVVVDLNKARKKCKVGLVIS